MLWLEIIFLIIFIALSAFFSGSETALVSVDWIKVKALLKNVVIEVDQTEDKKC
ncbi:MAG: CNNM domain-containing protein [archaeon]